jgi:hypothetical protein
MRGHDYEVTLHGDIFGVVAGLVGAFSFKICSTEVGKHISSTSMPGNMKPPTNTRYFWRQNTTEIP